MTGYCQRWVTSYRCISLHSIFNDARCRVCVGLPVIRTPCILINLRKDLSPIRGCNSVTLVLYNVHCSAVMILMFPPQSTTYMEVRTDEKFFGCYETNFESGANLREVSIYGNLVGWSFTLDAQFVLVHICCIIIRI